MFPERYNPDNIVLPNVTIPNGHRKAPPTPEGRILDCPHFRGYKMRLRNSGLEYWGNSQFGNGLFWNCIIWEKDVVSLLNASLNPVNKQIKLVVIQF